MTPHDLRTLAACKLSVETARQRLRDGELDSADAHLSEVAGWLGIVLRDAETQPLVNEPTERR